MPLHIDWQDDCGPITRQMDIACFNACLRLSFAEETLCDASWETSNQQTHVKQSEQAEGFYQYLLNPDYHSLHLRLRRHRSAFFHRVWNTLLTIPQGQTCSYADLARQLDTSPRAIARACRDNPYAGFIPCHRVTAKNGIGGFMGHIDGPFIALKQHILAQEKLLAQRT